MNKLVTLTIAGLGLLLQTSCEKIASKQVDFVADVKPILSKQCVNCHCSIALTGNLNLENKAMAFRARPTGPAIIPNDPDHSPLYHVLTLPVVDDKAMPPKGHRIPDADSRVIYQWIKQGAPWPEGADGVITPTVPQPTKGVGV